MSTGLHKPLIQNAYNARYVPSGHIVFMRFTTLWAVPFDAETLEITGNEVPVIESVESMYPLGRASYAFADDGLLVYLPGGETSGEGNLSKTLLWVDCDGNEQALTTGRDFLVPELSPDGSQIALVIDDGPRENVWILNLERNNALSKLTFDEQGDDYPIWSPDSSRIAFSSFRDGGSIWWKAADGSGEAEALLLNAPGARPLSFTPDGTQLVFTLRGDL